VHIISRKHLKEAGEKYENAAKELNAWYAIVKRVRWKDFTEVRSTFTDADYVDGYVVFDIRNNRYITKIVYCHHIEGEEGMTEGHVFIKNILTHTEYNNRANWERKI